MDLLKTMLENRKAAGVVERSAGLTMNPIEPPRKSLKAEIIEKKPKSHKKLKEHFEAIIERYCTESSSDEEYE